MDDVNGMGEATLNGDHLTLELRYHYGDGLPFACECRGQGYPVGYSCATEPPKAVPSRVLTSFRSAVTSLASSASARAT